jgi:5-methylcytosine-specific restriction endonuclease McrA
MSIGRIVGAFVAGLTLLAGACACDPSAVAPPDGNPPSAFAAAPDAAAAKAQLDGLVVGEWGSMSGYKRDRFPTWTSQGHGCDTRDAVLQREGTAVQVGEKCAITGGSWVSPYDGKQVMSATDLDIDHIVPLANAWRTGAAAWTDDQREKFANDLDRPQLIAVSASSNRSKGDQDPSQWRPPNKGFWCTYAQDWIEVKAYWRLKVTTAEKAALVDMLGTCP